MVVHLHSLCYEKKKVITITHNYIYISHYIALHFVLVLRVQEEVTQFIRGRTKSSRFRQFVHHETSFIVLYIFSILSVPNLPQICTASSSVQIFGILKQMQYRFEVNFGPLSIFHSGYLPLSKYIYPGLFWVY